MQKLLQDGRMIILPALLALSSLILLAGSLDDLEFRSGERIGGAPAGETGVSIKLGQVIARMAEVPLWKQALAWIAVFVFMLLVSSLLTPELRKQLIRDFLRVSAVVLAVFFLARGNPEIFTSFLDPLSQSGRLGAAQPQAGAARPVFEPPQVPDWLAFAIAFIFTLLLAWLLRRAYLAWAKARAIPAAQTPLPAIRKAAREALVELDRGGGFEHAILRCYSEMCRAVGEVKGLRRQSAMTPSEFSMKLAQAGLPAGPVDRLTQLFEAVRYGDRRGGRVESDQAAASLRSILDHCGGAR
jgi:hypothetical protein